MDRRDRAKQFQPFDALKGLQEELRRREEKRLREPRRTLSEEEAERLSRRISRLQKGSFAEITFYEGGHYITRRGEITVLDPVFLFLFLDEKKIFFADIYRIREG